MDCPCGDACDALAWHRKRIAELEQQVASDCLTGLWNRAHFERLLEAELDRSRRYRQPVSLILFDIDHFKRVNDVHGHQAGDAVLRETGPGRPVGAARLGCAFSLGRGGVRHPCPVDRLPRRG
jgi:predicted signal transduction protein with EAL and GGDEF domain